MEPHMSSPSPCSCRIVRVAVEIPLSRVGHTHTHTEVDIYVISEGHLLCSPLVPSCWAQRAERVQGSLWRRHGAQTSVLLGDFKQQRN